MAAAGHACPCPVSAPSPAIAARPGVCRLARPIVRGQARRQCAHGDRVDWRTRKHRFHAIRPHRLLMNPPASAIAELPLYAGIALKDIVPIDSAESAEQARLALLAADRIGFDTESETDLRKGEQYQRRDL